MTSTTTKAYRAISPSKNVQWSGKTLRMAFLRNAAPPTRSSSALASELPFIAIPHPARLHRHNLDETRAANVTLTGR
ncbi:hypothetical protein GCM10022224_043830 [Nonomuraea antimicrobica]|uniref:Uncharacterized protein n=1 Tax=Nonomuraea antimicrobica TaxID=561173 RepID=A0ABP7C218_9ACTN